MSLSSSGRRLEGFVGDAALEFVFMGEADDGVAAFDVVVEEVEAFAGDMGFEPEGDFAEFDGERVEVHAVDAVADDIADGFTKGQRAGLVFTGADDGEFGGDAAGGIEEDVAAAAGDVADAEEQERLLLVLFLELVPDQIIERVLDERLDEFIGGVVRAGGGAAFALHKGEFKAVVVGRDDWVVFEQAFIDRAEFLDVERTVIDADALAGVGMLEGGEVAETFEQGLVVQLAFVEQANGFVAEQIAGERGDAEFRPRYDQPRTGGNWI